jgi:DNA-binding phage protein
MAKTKVAPMRPAAVKTKNFIQNVGDLIRKNRALTAVAREAGFSSPQALHEIVAGKRKKGCVLESAIAIADVLGFGMDELFADPEAFRATIEKIKKQQNIVSNA